MGRKKEIYLEDVANRALRLVDGTLDDLERLRRQSRKSEKDDPEADFQIDLISINALDKTTRSLNGLLKEIRAIGKDAKESVGKLGHTDRQRLLKDYFAKLQPAHQHSLLLDLKQVYDMGRVKDFHEQPIQQPAPGPNKEHH